MWFPLQWPSGCPAAAPRAALSLAALGDMALSPEPAQRVRAEAAKLFPQKRLVWLTQEHTRIVLSADPVGSAGTVCGRTGDGLVTRDPDALIGVTVADCLPVFLWDAATGARAVCHSGWKGTGIVRDALSAMKARHGASPQTTYAILGPCIKACCYAVPRDRAEAFAASFGAGAAFSRGGAWYMDIAAANKTILLAEGVRAVHVHGECTCCDTRFSSYRRQGKAFTRMLALCGT
ncbi:MAG: polyphenol oxidase family protein [Treponema sp.]|nr:polyphenol oxidase family protein [Treponema sp.]